MKTSPFICFFTACALPVLAGESPPATPPETAPAPAAEAAAAPATPAPEPEKSPAPSAETRPTLILVKGAAGEAEYENLFQNQWDTWLQTASLTGAEIRTPQATPESPPTQTNRARLEEIFSALPREGPAAVWIVLIGHGTWNGQNALFNLEGPDFSANDLAKWLEPIQRPITVINTASSSAPFIPALAGPNRVIITATRSGNERNITRFGKFLAESLADPASDFDQDSHFSLLEWFLRASGRTAEFYLAEGRIQTEHPLIDDNGDGKGTPAEWFRGLRAVTKSKDNTPVDGTRAHQRSLLPDPTALGLSATQLTQRDQLEAAITALREQKSKMPENTYYQELEQLLLKLGSLLVPP